VVPYLRAQTAGREAELSPVIARTLRAPEVALADYLVAEREVEQLRSAFAQWFQNHDLLLCPVVTIPAPLHAQAGYDIAGVQAPARTVMRATSRSTSPDFRLSPCLSASPPPGCPSASSSSAGGGPTTTCSSWPSASKPSTP